MEKFVEIVSRGIMLLYTKQTVFAKIPNYFQILNYKRILQNCEIIKLFLRLGLVLNNFVCWVLIAFILDLFVCHKNIFIGKNCLFFINTSFTA
jgi:hypothetical protein